MSLSSDNQTCQCIVSTAGIGVDDMFVIVQAWNNLSPDTHKNQEIAERIGLALKHAVSSIYLLTIDLVRC